MNKKNILSLLLLICTVVKVNGQETRLQDFYYNNKVPSFTVPEKASLFKVENLSGIESAGQIPFEIPIYTIKLDELSIPISLKYNTKGTKVADISSNVGLGWALTGDGSIEYEKNDLKDFVLDSYIYDDIQFEPYPFEYRLTSGYLMPENNIELPYKLNTRLDASPDYYHVNAPSFKNSFYLRKDLSVCPNDNCGYEVNQFLPVFLSNSFVKSDAIKRVYEGGIAGRLNKENQAYIKDFNFISDIGYVYEFTDPIYISTTNYVYKFDGNWNDTHQSYRTNWKLKNIKSPLSGKSIKYNYEAYSNTYQHEQLIRNYDFFEGTLNTGNLVKGILQNESYNTRTRTTFYNTKRLSSIIGDKEEVHFIYDDTRLDYPGGRIKEIIIKNKNNITIRKISFEHSYFTSDIGCTDKNNCLRLKLDRIVDTGGGVHTFEYDNNQSIIYPPRSSSKVDFQGYFNNNSSNIVMFSDNDLVSNPSIPKTYNFYPKSVNRQQKVDII